MNNALGKDAMNSAAAAIFTLCALSASTVSAQKLKVVTTTTDLHSIAHAVGGSRITAIAISAGYQDPHFVEAKPSFVLKLSDADLFAFVGLDLEVGWAPLLIESSRNRKIAPGSSGYVDVSKAIRVRDVAQGTVDRSQGDVHPRGNPHYWLHPENGRLIARLFRDKFTELDPAGAAEYDRNLKVFETALDASVKSWETLIADIRGKPVVAWHTSWRYFADFTGMNLVGFMEPKPGVPPSPAHLAGLIQTMKRTGAKIIIMEPFYNRKTADLVANKTGAKVLVLPPSVGGRKELTSYLSVLAYNLGQVAEAVR